MASCCGGGYPPMCCGRVLPKFAGQSESCGGGWRPCPGRPCCVPTFQPRNCPSPCEPTCESPCCIPIAYPCPCPRRRCSCCCCRCGNEPVTSWPPNYGCPPQQITLNLNNSQGPNRGRCFSSTPSLSCPPRCTCCGRQGRNDDAYLRCLGRGASQCDVASPCVDDGLKYRDGCGPPCCRPCCARPCCNLLPPCCVDIRPVEPKCCPSRCCKPPPYSCPDPCIPQRDPRCCPKPMILAFRCPIPSVPACRRNPCPDCGPNGPPGFSGCGKNY